MVIKYGGTNEAETKAFNLWNGSIIKEGEVESLTGKILLSCDKLQVEGEINGISATRFSGKNIALNYKKILVDNDHLLLNDWF